MLTILGRPTGRFCDGVSRRDFLKIGGLALGGLSLPQILEAQAASGVRNSHKAIIMIFLPGGPPHQDMWDLKTDAPREIRGEFKPIKTNVAGIEICEHFPRIASMMDKFVRHPLDRTAATARTYAFQCMTGWRRRDPGPQGGRPCLGSVLVEAVRAGRSVGAAVRRPVAEDGAHGLGRRRPAGFLGLAHAPFKPDGEGMANMTLHGRVARSAVATARRSSPASIASAPPSTPAARWRGSTPSSSGPSTC